jgi:hypothetical protein
MFKDANDMSKYREALKLVQSNIAEFKQFAETLSLEENWEVILFRLYIVYVNYYLLFSFSSLHIIIFQCILY